MHITILAASLSAEVVRLNFEGLTSGTYIRNALKKEGGVVFNGHFIGEVDEANGNTSAVIRFVQSSSGNMKSDRGFESVSFDYQMTGQAGLRILVFGAGPDGRPVVVGSGVLRPTEPGAWSTITVQVEGVGYAVDFGHVVRDTTPPVIDNVILTLKTSAGSIRK